MSDPADDRAAFRAAMQRAEEAAGITRDDSGNEQAAEETPVATPELPEAVPVQASDQPITPDPAEPAATSEQEPVTPAVPAVAEPTQTIEEQLAAAQARLEEKDSFIGRQSSEVGELRGIVDELKTRLDAQAAQQPTTPEQRVVITQDLIDSNPAYAVQAAFAQKDEQALGLAFESWKLEEPFEASTWLNDRRREQESAALRAELEATRSELKSIATPLAETAAAATEHEVWNAAFSTVVATRPDFLQHAERLLEEVAPKFPNIVSVLAGADAKGKAEVLTALYDLDRAQATDPAQVREELQRQAAEATAEAEAARQGAHVVSQTTVGQPGVEKTTEELEQEAYVHRMTAKPSLARGWTGRA